VHRKLKLEGKKEKKKVQKSIKRRDFHGFGAKPNVSPINTTACIPDTDIDHLKA